MLSTGEEANKKVMDVFTEFSRDLRQLRDFPLSITSLQGASPAFRYTEVTMAIMNGDLRQLHTMLSLCVHVGVPISPMEWSSVVQV